MSFVSSILEVQRRAGDGALIDSGEEVLRFRDLGVMVAPLAELPASAIVVIAGQEDRFATFALMAACVVARRPFYYCAAAQPAEDAVARVLFTGLERLALPGRGGACWVGGLREELREHVDVRGLVTFARTSGSTGHSKVIPLRDWNYEAFSGPALRTLGLKEGCRFGDFAHLPSDMTLTNLLLCLRSGALWCPLLGWRDRTFPLAACHSRGVTHLRLVPSSLPVLAGEYRRKATVPAALRTVCFGGERLMREAVSGLQSMLPDVTVVNSYGATELAGFSSAEVIPPGSAPRSSATSVEIGEPFEGYTYRVNEESELVVSGARLPPRYLVVNEEGARHVTHPVSATGEPMFVSRDLVERTENGLAVIGRSDGLRKVKGIFVDLDFLESAISKEFGVEAMCVAGEGLLYCLIEETAAEKLNDLSSWLNGGRANPGFATKACVVARLPRSGSGKKDRRQGLALITG